MSTTFTILVVAQAFKRRAGVLSVTRSLDNEFNGMTVLGGGEVDAIVGGPTIYLGKESNLVRSLRLDELEYRWLDFGSRVKELSVADPGGALNNEG